MALLTYQLLLIYAAVALCANQLSPAQMKDFESILLKCHNSLRKNHKARNLTPKPELHKTAQKYAQKLASIGDLKHSTGRDNTGENLYSAATSVSDPQEFISTYKQIAADACKSWYCEENKYKYDNLKYVESHLSDIRHFSQMVWKDSKQAGFGVYFVQTPNQQMKNHVYVVGHYQDAGNVKPIDNFKENVDSPRRKCPCAK